MLKQSAPEAESSGTPVRQPDGHREMWARVRECDDKHKCMIERVEQENDAANLMDEMLSNVDRKYAPEDGESETAVQEAVDELDKNSVAENANSTGQYETNQTGCTKITLQRTTSYPAVNEWQTQ